MDDEARREFENIIAEMASKLEFPDFEPMHRMFLMMKAGGFTEDQCLRIIAYGLFHLPNTDPEPGEQE